MKNVILLGDSIRVGYQPYVTKQLEGWADVWGPEDNCRHSRYMLENLEGWIADRPADIIHVNCGLHDMALDHAEGEDLSKMPAAGNLVPFDEYKKNVRNILEILKDKTSATIIWRTTTPSLLERQLACGKNRKRTPEDVDKYNAAANEIARDMGFAIHDLYQQVIELGAEDIMTNDGIHYTDEGYEKLAEKVSQKIREVAGE